MASAGKIRGITIELNADASGFKSALSSVNSSLSSTQKQLNDVNKLMKFEPTSATLANQKYELLQKKIGDTKDKLDLLKQAEAQLTSEMENGGTEKQQQQLAALQREIISTENYLKQLENTEGSGSATLLHLGNQFQAAGEKITNIGENLKAVSAAFAALEAAAVAAFKQVDEGADAVVEATGATGDMADDLINSYENVATSVKGSFSDIGSVVGNVSTRFGVTGQELESLSTEFQKFANITGQDGYTAVQNISQAMRLFNVDTSEAENVMGLFAKVSQDTGISVSSLESTITSSGVTLQEMGLNLSDSVNLIAQFDKEGVDASQVLTKMNKAATYFTQNGKDMSSGLQDLVARLQDSSTHTDAVAETFDIFGNKAGNAFVKLAESGKINLKAAGSSLSDYANVVDDTYEQTEDGLEQMSNSWKSLQVSLSALGKSLGSTLAPIMEKVASVVKNLADGFSSLSPATQNTIVKIGLLVAAISPVAIAVGKATSAIGTLIKSFSSASLGANVYVAAIAAVVAAIGALIIAGQEQYEAEYATVNAAKEAASEAQKLNDAYLESASSAKVSADSQKELEGQLLNLVDANGKVKEGEEERAKNILEQLNSQLGTQYELTGNVITANGEEIKSNQELSDSIQDIINQKEAQALLDANQEAYTNAIKEVNENIKNEAKAYDDLTRAQENYNKVLKNYNDTMEQSGQEQAMAEFGDELGRATTELAKAEQAYDSYSSAVAEDNQIIQRQKELQEAVAQGGESLSNALQKETANITLYTGENNSAVAKSAQEALESFKLVEQEYEKTGTDLAKENKNTMAQITMEQVNELNKAGQLTADEIGKMDSSIVSALMSVGLEGKLTGEAQTAYEAMKQTISGKLDEVTSDVSSKLGNIVNITNDETNQCATLTDANGNQMKVYMDGHMTDMNNNAINSLEDFKNTISSKTDQAANNASTQGASITSSLVLGMDSISGQVDTEANKIADSASNINKNSGSAWGWGWDFVSQFASGISNGESIVSSAASSLAGIVAQFLHFSLPDKGPLANSDEWMPDFMDLLSSGIDDNKSKVLTQVQELAKEMQTTMADPFQSAMQIGMNVSGSGSASVGSTVNNYNFNQTNNSPKSLSRLEIYRNSKRLIRMANNV